MRRLHANDFCTDSNFPIHYEIVDFPGCGYTTAVIFRSNVFAGNTPFDRGVMAKTQLFWSYRNGHSFASHQNTGQERFELASSKRMMGWSRHSVVDGREIQQLQQIEQLNI